MSDIKHGGSYGGESPDRFVSGLFGNSGGYSFDRSTLDHIASEFEGLAREFDLDVDTARVITRTQPPGLDFASGDNAKVFQGSGEALVKSLQDRAEYCRKQAGKFRKALGGYTAAEDTHATDVKNIGGSL
ncbi:hypothetical protein [Amycolatopsis sp. NPDC004079]|uniref:hypothetical protein n=1 Tax=Amycolatopsis sp. NPDC004079 TaxID=3154549 RepID=UPI0033B01049